MTKNTPEAMQEVFDKLMSDILQKEYCSKWDCSKCPIYLQNDDEDQWNVPYKCGWLLVKSAILKKQRG